MKINNLVGKRFGKLTVVERDGSRKGNVYWICQCECGTKTSVRASSLTSGDTTTCGSGICKEQAIEVAGQRFGQLTGIKYLSKGMAEFECDCGNVIIARSVDVRRGKSTSCGKCVTTKFLKHQDGYMVGVTNRGERFLFDSDDYGEVSRHNWWIDENYVQAKINGVKTRLHRMVMQAPTGKMVDHINHNTLDNRKDNLRICESQQNQFNQLPKTDRTKGVEKLPSGNWRARIIYNQKFIQIGVYPTKEEAALAYNKKAKELFGEYANLNKIK